MLTEKRILELLLAPRLLKGVLEYAVHVIHDPHLQYREVRAQELCAEVVKRYPPNK